MFYLGLAGMLALATALEIPPLFLEIKDRALRSHAPRSPPKERTLL